MEKIIVISFMLLLVACGGRSANPIQVKQMGDTKKSCEALEVEMSAIEQKIARLIPESKKTGKNAALATAGVFLIIPAFFIDLSDAERVEIEALRDRYTYLQSNAADKKCSLSKAS